MGKYKVNSELTGLVGPFIVYERNGTKILRRRAASRKDKSPKIKKARKNFSFMIDMMIRIKPLTDIGFKGAAPNRTAYHYGLSVNTNSYLEAKRLEQTDNYAWIRLSEGKLSGAGEFSANVSPEGILTVQWSGTEKGRDSFENDLAYVGVFLRSTKTFIKNSKEVTRDKGELSFQIGKLKEGEKADLFLFFEKYDGKGCSNSQWQEIE